MNLAIEQILTQIVAFLIMLWILKKFFWKPILNLMEERKQIISLEFDLIRQEKQGIKKLAEEYHHKLTNIESEARAKIHDAVEKGEILAREIERETRDKAAEILNKAQIEVQKEIVQAKNQLKVDIVNMSIAATQKLIQETLSKEKHEKLIEDTIKQIDAK